MVASSTSKWARASKTDDGGFQPGRLNMFSPYAAALSRTSKLDFLPTRAIPPPPRGRSRSTSRRTARRCRPERRRLAAAAPAQHRRAEATARGRRRRRRLPPPGVQRSVRERGGRAPPRAEGAPNVAPPPRPAERAARPRRAVRCCVRRIAPASVLAAALAAQRDELLRPAPAPAASPPTAAERAPSATSGARGAAARGPPPLAAAAPAPALATPRAAAPVRRPPRRVLRGRRRGAIFAQSSRPRGVTGPRPAGTASSSASRREAQRQKRPQRLDALHDDRGRKRARPGSTEPGDDDDGRRPSRPPNALRPGRAKASFAATDLAAAPLAASSSSRSGRSGTRRARVLPWPCRTARRGRRRQIE